MPACSVPTTAGAASANGVSQTAGVPSRVSSRRPMATRPTATAARFSANQSRRKVQKSGETRPSRRGSGRNVGGYSKTSTMNGPRFGTGRTVGTMGGR